VLKKLSGNILIYGGTSVLKSLVPLFMLPILTVYLSPKDYGILSLIEVAILFLTPFITLNINSFINIEFFKVSQKELSQYITNALILSFISACLFLVITFFAKSMIADTLKISSLLVIWIPIFVLLRVVSSVVLGLYQVSEQPVKFAIYTLLQTAIDFALSYILVAVFYQGYIGRLEGIYGAFLVTSIYGIYILWGNGYISNKITFKYSKEILMYGMPLIPHVLGGVILAMSDRYFISYYVGNTMVGYYSVAYQMAALMLLISTSVNQAWMPMLYKLLVNHKKNKKLINRYTFLLFLLYTISGLIIYYVSDIIFSLFVDKKFYEAKIFFPILLLGFVLQSYYYLFTNFLFFYKKTWLLAKITFFSAILNLILNYFLILSFGTMGVAYATVITYAVYLLIVWYVSIRPFNSKVVS